MKIIRQSKVFSKWLAKLRDVNAVARIQIRIKRLSLGNFGDVKPIGSGLSELRIDYGPGYRVYFLQEGEALIVLLCGGDKSRQADDIAQAKQLAALWHGADEDITGAFDDKQIQSEKSSKA